MEGRSIEEAPRVDRSLANEFEGDKKLSFWMDVRVEKVFDDGEYDAKLVNVGPKQTKFGVALMWTFEIDGEDVRVNGFTSMSPSTWGKAYQWAAAIAEEIDPKLGWGPEDVIGGECVVALEAAEDDQGVEKNKVVNVKPPKKGKTGTANSPR